MTGNNPLFLFELFGIITCIIGSAFFSGSETALTRISTTRAMLLIEHSPARFGLLKIWLDHKKRILAALLIGNNLVNILCSVLAYRISYYFLPNYAEFISVFGLTLIILVFAEITPKSFALRYSEQVAIPVLRIVWVIDKLLFPFSWPLSRLPGLFDPNSSLLDDEPVATEDEIEFHIRRGLDKSIFEEKSQGELLMSALEFSDKMVKEIMIPRTDMVCLQQTVLLGDALNLLIKSGHSRVPVFSEEIDKIVGMLFAKDLLFNIYNNSEDKNKPVASIMRDDPFFVPETQKISHLLADMRRKSLHMSIVVDEFGGTAGIVTLEDIIEELVGEIRDEFDPDEPRIRKIDKKRWQLDARLAISDLEHETKISLPDTGDYESVGGFVVARYGRIPKRGKIIRVDQIEIIVIDSDDRHVKRLEIRIK